MLNSTQGIQAAGGVGQYAATQHAMRAITDSLRQEVNADGIRVCSIHLGRTATRAKRPSSQRRHGHTYPTCSSSRQTWQRSWWPCSPSYQRGGHGDPSPAGQEELLMRMLATGDIAGRGFQIGHQRIDNLGWGR